MNMFKRFSALVFALIVIFTLSSCLEPQQTELNESSSSDIVKNDITEITSENVTEVQESSNPVNKTETTSENTTEAPENNNSNADINNKGNITLDQKIKKVKEVFNTIESNKNQHTQKIFGTSATGYYENGVLRMLNEYPEYDPQKGGYGDGQKEKFFYFEDGELYFIFLIDANTKKEDRLYYYDGELIRWIDSSSAIHDNENKLKEMDEWYSYAISQYNSVKTY